VANRARQQAVLLLLARISSVTQAHQQRQPDPHPRADRARTRGDFSQTRDNTGAIFT